MSRTRDRRVRGDGSPAVTAYVVRVRDTSTGKRTPAGTGSAGAAGSRTPAGTGSAGVAGRHQAFAAFVRKALADARSTRMWNGSEVARRTGVSRQTINRWVRGDWTNDPEPARVVAFCDGLGIDPPVAFGILGWDRSAPARPAPEPPPMDPDIAALLRRLVDPSVSESEKYHIRETVRYLAYRPPIPDDREKRGRRAG
jgi:transcriptional regulator with XRE-family HTH domain